MFGLITVGSGPFQVVWINVEVIHHESTGLKSVTTQALGKNNNVQLLSDLYKPVCERVM